MQISRVDIISSLLPVLKNQIEHTDRKGNTPKIKKIGYILVNLIYFSMTVGENASRT